MPRLLPATLLPTFLLLSGVAVAGETLRCQSIDGNVNCAGSHGVSCQTINGKKTCVSGHGDVVQSFGQGDAAAERMQPPPLRPPLPAWVAHPARRGASAEPLADGDGDGDQ